MIYRQEVCWSGSRLTTSNAAWALKLCKSSTLYNELICERMQLLECKHQSIDLWYLCCLFWCGIKGRTLTSDVFNLEAWGRGFTELRSHGTTSRTSHCQNTQTAGPSASFSEARSIVQTVHTVIAWDEKVLHNAAAYSFQEQSGAPSLCHTPKSAGKLMIYV